MTKAKNDKSKRPEIMQKKTWSSWVTIVTSFFVLALGGLGIYSALNSNLFLLRAIDIRLMEEDAHVNAPLSVNDIRDISSLKVGKVNLFSLDLDRVETLIESHPWIDRVTLSKQFPQTLIVDVKYRQALGLVQEESGDLTYLDAMGNRFGKLDVSVQSDLPVITGLEEKAGEADEAASRLIKVWNYSRMSEIAQLSSIDWNDEKGFRALIVYYLSSQKKLVRSRLDLGPDRSQILDTRLGDQLNRLAKVVEYLQSHGIAAMRFLAAGRQKIVVKTDRGS